MTPAVLAVFLALAPCTRPIGSGVSATTWSPPLNRVVSFRVSELSLREALDRLAAMSHVRVSYSSEALQLDRVVCVAMDSVPVGDILVVLLEGAGVEPVAAGGEHVVLAPVKTVAAAPAPREAVPFVMDRIVVTGTPGGAAWKPLPVALDVVGGQSITGRSVGSLSEAFNSLVPGLWMWEQSPSSLIARYGSIRGTSSFALSYPKVYIDGIQVANPLLFTRIAPETVERIEVIRGPQGAALYGADAISGVANIVMRNETVDAGGSQVRVRSGFGLASSAFGSNPSLGQDHVLTFSSGSNTRSFGINFEGGGTGEYIPDAYRRKFAVSSTGRSVGARTVLTGIGRFYTEHAGTPASPLLPPFRLPQDVATTASTTTGQTVAQYTLGTNLKYSPSERFTSTLVFGVDGYSLDGVIADDRLPIPSATDAALLAARGGANRFTLHVGTVSRVARGPGVSADLSFVAEHSMLFQWTDSAPGPNVGGASLWRSNSGASGQLTLGVLDHLFLTAGTRFERTSGNRNGAALPMLGSSLVLGSGLVKAKLRAAYGKGIRWPETAVRETMWNHERAPLAVPLPLRLAPEEQSGVEAGADLLVGKALSVQFTRFDQTATGLIQRVLTDVDTIQKRLTDGTTRTEYKVFYQMQNVGRIGNKGWEMQGSVGGGPLVVTGALALTDSRVLNVEPGYTGDLQNGHRMPDVPRLTLGGTVTWSTPRFGASLTATRANDWIGYDKLELARDLWSGRLKPQIVGDALATYRITYPGFTRLRATTTVRISPVLALSLTGDNLLNYQRGEPDNLTILPGRTITAGFRAEF